MSLGNRLRAYLTDGIEQKVIAMGWIERMKEAGEKPLSPATVTSRLSELLADDPQGVRTFFRDPKRSAALFEVLGVPDGDQEELRRLAEPVLEGSVVPRLVVDVSDLPDDQGAMDVAFAGIRERILQDGLFPMAIVLTETQFERLPRSYDAYGERLHVEKVPASALGGAAALRLAGAAGPIASRRPLVDLSRWWAIGVENGKFAVEPPNGLEQLRATGRISLPDVEFPLAPNKDDEVVPVPVDGPARRRLMRALAEEADPVNLKPIAWRRGAAKALGVTASSTAQERAEEAISAIAASLGLPLAPVAEEEREAWDEMDDPERMNAWEGLVMRAARRPTGPVARRIGDTVFLLNPVQEVQARPHLTIVRVSCEEPALVTLERAIAAMSEDDLLDDPRLGRLVDRLAAGDEKRLHLLLHARAVLVYGGRVRPAADPRVADPVGALTALFEDAPPKALLRMRVMDRAAEPFGSRFCSVRLPPLISPDGPTSFDDDQSAWLLNLSPQVGDVLIGRESSIWMARALSGWEDQYQGEPGRPKVLVNPKADADSWLDDVEAQDSASWNSSRHLPDVVRQLDWGQLALPQGLWRDADTELALSWLAIREALAVGPRIGLPDGGVLAAIGGGLAIRAIVRPFGNPQDVTRGALVWTVHLLEDRTKRAMRWQVASHALCDAIATHRAAGYGVGPLLPSLWVAGNGVAATIEFVSAPMLPGRGAQADAARVGAITVALAAEIEADERRRQDD